ncbi:hypothetical protein HAP47_0003785 [Bradyrhizobium sp. 41S5]|uniref:hypothetical protein n=1 Tax=Bradyrhizobium sp. 41S5 TaxID=1404443 RepID=UPI001E591828|nr:hypothetical protein [Bradyrhizobium sp. 41S5]UFX45851.1 hypothetical protein HAP47_0003785 [Bradyrhizobium sp. 41S5]
MFRIMGEPLMLSTSAGEALGCAGGDLPAGICCAADPGGGPVTIGDLADHLAELSAVHLDELSRIEPLLKQVLSRRSE